MFVLSRGRGEQKTFTLKERYSTIKRRRITNTIPIANIKRIHCALAPSESQQHHRDTVRYVDDKRIESARIPRG
jgi:hypothetical protein